MDGGVPIVSPVAGIAMGLMHETDSKYKILTDIQGPEDHHGDMDFKVAGTEVGVTAVQMDVKVAGIPLHVLKDAFEKAKSARLQILKVMTGAIAVPREKISEYAPHIVSIKVKQDQIGLVIGTGGKTIKEIKEKTGVDAIDIDDGSLKFKKEKKFIFTDPMIYWIAMNQGGVKPEQEVWAPKLAEICAGEFLARRYDRVGYAASSRSGEVDFYKHKKWAIEVKWAEAAHNLSPLFKQIRVPEKMVWTMRNIFEELPAA